MENGNIAVMKIQLLVIVRASGIIHYRKIDYYIHDDIIFIKEIFQDD